MNRTITLEVLACKEDDLCQKWWVSVADKAGVVVAALVAKGVGDGRSSVAGVLRHDVSVGNQLEVNGIDLGLITQVVQACP